MIKITKKSNQKLNELFTLDGSNIFEPSFDFENDCATFSNGRTDYYVGIIGHRFRGLMFSEIAYGIDTVNGVKYKPKGEEYSEDKGKVINTVLYIVKKFIEECDENFLYFSGDNSTGLGPFYKILIRNLKLNQIFDIFEMTVGGVTDFYLIRKKLFQKKISNSKFFSYADSQLVMVELRTSYIIDIESILTKKPEITKLSYDNFEKFISYLVNDLNNSELHIVWSDCPLSNESKKSLIELMNNLGYIVMREADDKIVFYNENK